MTTNFKSIDELSKKRSPNNREKIKSLDKTRDEDLEELLTESQNFKYIDLKNSIFETRRPNN